MPYFHHVHHKHPSFRGTKISFLSVVPSISSYSLSRQQWAVMKCHPNQAQTSHTQSQAVWIFETDGERSILYKSADFANGLQKEKKSPLSPNKIRFWTVQKSCTFHQQRLPWHCLFSNPFHDIVAVLWPEGFLGQNKSWIWISNIAVHTVETSLSGSTLVF